jgi:hypothetical protein
MKEKVQRKAEGKRESKGKDEKLRVKRRRRRRRRKPKRSEQAPMSNNPANPSSVLKINSELA